MHLMYKWGHAAWALWQPHSSSMEPPPKEIPGMPVVSLCYAKSLGSVVCSFSPCYVQMLVSGVCAVLVCVMCS